MTTTQQPTLDLEAVKEAMNAMARASERIMCLPRTSDTELAGRIAKAKEGLRPLLAALEAAPRPSQEVGNWREAAARIIDHEGYWERLDNLNAAIRLGIGTDDQHMELCHKRDEELVGTEESLSKADQIAALTPAPGHEAEPVAWRWRHSAERYAGWNIRDPSAGRWTYQETKPDVKAGEAWTVEIQPLYAHPAPAPDVGEEEIALGEPCTLAACPVGLFLTEDHGTLGLKSEYGTNEGAIDAYIVASGEYFWGDQPQTIASQRAQIVRPIAHADVLSRLARKGA